MLSVEELLTAAVIDISEETTYTVEGKEKYCENYCRQQDIKGQEYQQRRGEPLPRAFGACLPAPQQLGAAALLLGRERLRLRPGRLRYRLRLLRQRLRLLPGLRGLPACGRTRIGGPPFGLPCGRLRTPVSANVLCGLLFQGRVLPSPIAL